MNRVLKSTTLFKGKRQRLNCFFAFILSFMFLSETVYAQSRVVTGIVYGDGEALIGANIKEKGTNNGTITYLDGKFSFRVNNGASLEVSYLGYETKTVHITTI